MLAIEKNRCIPGERSRGAVAAVGARFSELAGTISETILGTAGFPVTQSLSYTEVSRRGEVAERLKAAVC